ncbi:hypothetical protein X975_08107, partial [Stegodyphus mimosarum]
MYLCKTNQKQVEIIKQNNICFQCFSSGCNAKKCRARNCFCGKAHHPMFHFRKPNKVLSKIENSDADQTQCNS